MIKKEHPLSMNLLEDEHEVDHNPPDEGKLAKRANERKINFIIEKVFEWRMYYNGFTNENGEYIKLSLDEAAIKVGISKKSLDDYLNQLR